MSLPHQRDGTTPFYAPAKIRKSDPSYPLQCRSSGGGPGRSGGAPPSSAAVTAPCTANIMYDRRIVRGNTYALRPKSAPAVEEGVSAKSRCVRLKPASPSRD